VNAATRARHQKYLAARDRLRSERERGMVASRALDPEVALALLAEVDAELWAWSPSTCATYRLRTDTTAALVVGEEHAALLALHEAHIVGMDRWRNLLIDDDGVRHVVMLIVTAVTGRGFLDELRGGGR
jgi:hypothetical protein